VGGACGVKQKITREWEEFVRKSRRSSGSRRSLYKEKQKLPRSGRSFWGKAEDQQGVRVVC
jgi:hypothetical protein